MARLDTQAQPPNQPLPWISLEYLQQQRHQGLGRLKGGIQARHLDREQGVGTAGPEAYAIKAEGHIQINGHIQNNVPCDMGTEEEGAQPSRAALARYSLCCRKEYAFPGTTAVRLPLNGALFTVMASCFLCR